MGGNKKVIFVLVGSLDSCQLDPNLRLLLKNNIVLQWGDSLFWEKMRYSLPDQQQEAQPQVPASVYSTYRPPHQFNKNLHGQINAGLHIEPGYGYGGYGRGYGGYGGYRRGGYGYGYGKRSA